MIPRPAKSCGGTRVSSNAIPSPVANNEMVFISAGFPAKIAMAIPLGGVAILLDAVSWKYAKGTAYVPSADFVR